MRVKFIVAVVLAFACVASSNASAGPMTLATPGIVGTLDGKVGSSNETIELGIAQAILDLVGLGAVSPAGCITPDNCYMSSTVFDYSGTLSNPVQSGAGDNTVNPGFAFVLAKYNGQNGGYVLFHLPTFGSNTLPQFPDNFWTTTGQYALSHHTTFTSDGPVVTPRGVPDGGSTAALLGSILFAVGFVRRRLSA